VVAEAPASGERGNIAVQVDRRPATRRTAVSEQLRSTPNNANSPQRSADEPLFGLRRAGLSALDGHCHGPVCVHAENGGV
jgi:hypothetical protein